MSLKQQLFNRYLAIVKENQEFLDSTLSIEKLSKLFLTPVTDNYESAKNKIMIVGRETNDWLTSNKQFNSNVYDEDYIQKLMDKSHNYFVKTMDGSQAQGAGFFNFLKKIANKSGKEGLIWSNVYAFDYNKGHINNSKNKNLINGVVKISEELLKAQIEILKPDYIIFATGNEGVQARRQYFPNDKLTDKKPVGGFKVEDLWSFKLPDNDAICYRLHHPSAWGKKRKNEIESYLIDLLPSKE